MRKIAGGVPRTVKAGAWRELAGFDPLKDDTFDYDGTVKAIALIYGVPVEKVEDELELSEVLPVYLDCVGFMNQQIFERLNKVSKKKAGQ